MLWDVVKNTLREIYSIEYIRKEEISEMNNVGIYVRKLEKQKQ